MERITHDADDKKLATVIDKHNDAVAEHETTAVAIRQPPDVSDDELLTIPYDAIETFAAAYASERLTSKQGKARLTINEVDIRQAIIVESKDRADAGEKSYHTLVEKKKTALTKVGMGVESQPSFKHNPRAAARLFEQSILQSTDVRQADSERKALKRRLNHDIQLLEIAKQDAQVAQQALRQFVVQLITGENHHAEVQVPGRTNRRNQPVFQKA